MEIPDQTRRSFEKLKQTKRLTFGGSWVKVSSGLCYFHFISFQLFQEQLLTVENRCCCPRAVGILCVNLHKQTYQWLFESMCVEYISYHFFFWHLLCLQFTWHCLKTAVNKDFMLNRHQSIMSTDDYEGLCHRMASLWVNALMCKVKDFESTHDMNYRRWKLNLRD